MKDHQILIKLRKMKNLQDGRQSNCSRSRFSAFILALLRPSVLQITVNFLQVTAVAAAINVEWTATIIALFKITGSRDRNLLHTLNGWHALQSSLAPPHLRLPLAPCIVSYQWNTHTPFRDPLPLHLWKSRSPLQASAFSLFSGWQSISDTANLGSVC